MGMTVFSFIITKKIKNINKNVKSGAHFYYYCCECIDAMMLTVMMMIITTMTMMMKKDDDDGDGDGDVDDRAINVQRCPYMSFTKLLMTVQ